MPFGALVPNIEAASKPNLDMRIAKVCLASPSIEMLTIDPFPSDNIQPSWSNLEDNRSPARPGVVFLQNLDDVGLAGNRQ